MYLRKKTSMFLIGFLLLFTMVGCAKDEKPSIETDVLSNEPLPIETSEKEDLPDEETDPTESDTFFEAYLDILTEKNIEIISPNIGAADGEIAILDVFEDETPELLYIYSHEKKHRFDPDFSYPAFSLIIFTYSKPEGAVSAFDSIIFIAAGVGGDYCVYKTCEGKLMLYRSTFGGGVVSWGFWQITPNQNLEITEEYWAGNYCSDLAKLYYAELLIEEEKIYKMDGEEISKEQYEKTANEVMNEIEYVIFQGIDHPGYGLYERDDLWQGITPYEAGFMSYTEAIAWLELQINDRQDG